MVYKINPQMNGRTSGRFPDDFPHLTNEKRIAVWKDGDDVIVESTLPWFEIFSELKKLGYGDNIASKSK